LLVQLGGLTVVKPTRKQQFLYSVPLSVVGFEIADFWEKQRFIIRVSKSFFYSPKRLWFYTCALNTVTSSVP